MPPINSPVPLRNRWKDALYVAFFAIHLGASVAVDGQAFYPQHLVPKPLKKILLDYIQDSADPLVQNVWSKNYVWFTTVMVLEMLLQVPTFIYGMVAIVRDDRRCYPVLVAYATLASFSTLQCLATVLFGNERLVLSDANVRSLLGAYVPFTLLPIFMLVDMLIRTVRLVSEASYISEHQSSAYAKKSL